MKIDLNEALNHLDAMRQVDSDEGVANALVKVAVAYLERGKADLAQEPLEEAYYYCQKLDNDPGRAQVCLRQGQLELMQGQPGLAADKYREALAVFRSAGDKPGIVAALEGLAQALAAGDDAAGAAAALEEALALASEAGDRVAMVLLNQYLAPLYRQMHAPEKALQAYLTMGQGAQELGDTQRVALALVGMASMQALAGQLQTALKNLDQARRAFLDLGQLARVKQVTQEMVRLREAVQGQGG